MKRKAEYLRAYRDYLYRDRLIHHAQIECRWWQWKITNVWWHVRRLWSLWVDPPTTTRAIQTYIVNRRTCWLQGWALRGVTIALLVSLFAHLPAPTLFTPIAATDAVSAPYSRERPRPPRVLVYRSQADRDLLRACRDTLALRDARHDAELVRLALTGAEYYNHSTADYVSATR